MYMTMEEIEKKYDGNFVCIANCKVGKYHNVVGGEVIAVSKMKKEVQKFWGDGEGLSMCHWCGELPEEFRYILL
jgi:hypothetical protein